MRGFFLAARQHALPRPVTSLLATSLLALTLSGCGFSRTGSGDDLPAGLLPSAEEIAAIQASSLGQPPAAPTADTIDAQDLIASVQSFNSLQGKVSAAAAAEPALAAVAATTLPAAPDNRVQTASVSVLDTRQMQNIIRRVVASEKPALKQFYASRDYLPVWYNRFGWTAKADAMVSTLKQSFYDGLPGKRYGMTQSYSLPQTTAAHRLVGAELSLTLGAMLYLGDLTDGLDPKNRKSNARQRLQSALKAGELAAYIDRLRPKNRHYVGLSRALRSASLTSKQRGTILVNMERFRGWAPKHNGRHVWVNLPTQELYAYNGRAAELKMPVVVGQLSRQTPVMSDRITNLKFSPDWTVPQSIARKDILPILKEKGAAGVAAMNLRAMRRGKTVDLASVDWNKVRGSDYRFYQPPGPKNALGGVRFSLTNSQGIYLHDTPDRDLFRMHTRSISSGCVRVGDATALALWALKGKGWSETRVTDAMLRGKTETVSLGKALPVEFTYYTAYVDDDGRLRFGGDLYGLDRKLAQKMGL